MPQKAFSKIWIAIVLIILVSGGILSYRYWWVPRAEEIESLKEKPQETYSLVGAYLKKGDIWMKDFETNQEVKLTNIDKILIADWILSCEGYDELSLSKCFSEVYSEVYYGGKPSKLVEKKLSDPEIKRIEEELGDIPVSFGGIRENPIWSHNGTKIVLAKDAEEYIDNLKKGTAGDTVLSDLFILDLLNKKETPIARNINMGEHREENISFSLDEEKVAFHFAINELRRGRTELPGPEVVVTGVGREPKTVFAGLKGIGDINQIEWFKDNKRMAILYVKDFTTGGVKEIPGGEEYSIIVLDTESGSSQELISIPWLWGAQYGIGFFSLSSDNSKLSYISNDGIYVYNFKNKSTRKIYSSPKAIPKHLKWSPDSSFLAFSTPISESKEEESIIIMTDEGEVLRTYQVDSLKSSKEEQFRVGSLNWAPVGEKIAVELDLRYGGIGNEVWILGTDNEFQELIASGLPDFSIIWMSTELMNKIIDIYKE